MSTVSKESITLLDSVPEAYVRFDNEFRCTFVNQAAQLHLGKHRRELIGKRFRDVFQDGHLEDAAHDAMAEHALVTCDLYSEPEHKWYGITAAPDAAGGIFVRLADIPGSGRLPGTRKAGPSCNHDFRESPTTFRGLSFNSSCGRHRQTASVLGGEHGTSYRSRYLERWAARRRKPALAQMGVDEIHLGKKQKFMTVVSNLETGEPLWMGGSGRKRRWTSSSGPS